MIVSLSPDAPTSSLVALFAAATIAGLEIRTLLDGRSSQALRAALAIAEDQPAVLVEQSKALALID